MSSSASKRCNTIRYSSLSRLYELETSADGHGNFHSRHRFLEVGQDKTRGDDGKENSADYKAQNSGLGAAITRSVLIWLVVALLSSIVAPIAAVMPLLIAVTASVRIKRKTARSYTNETIKELAPVVDLYAASLRSGNSVLHASRHVTRWSRGPIAKSVQTALSCADSGSGFADALATASKDTAPVTNELFGALLSHLRYGTPILNDLERLSAHARDMRRKNGEVQARKLPIVLLFPLVVCVLPAYLMVTVAPVLIEAVETLTR